jgi:putative tryptophan/tyrosine transport system substrate-binding protein
VTPCRPPWSEVPWQLIGLVVLLAISLVVAPLAGEAQETGRVARIGYIFVGPSLLPPSSNTVAFMQGLRDLGWVEGSNLTIERRYANGKPERLPALVAELMRLKVGLIFATEPASALAAKQATAEVPIVFMSLGDPVVGGLVASLARPGGNLTGCAGMDPELAGKRLELLKLIVPRLTRVAFVTSHRSPLGPPHVREAQKAATALGIQLQVVEAWDPAEFERALQVIAKDRPDALYVAGNPNLFQQRPRVLGLVARARLPAIWSETAWVTDGGLIGYSPSQPEMFRRGAWYVDRILRGAKPADLPIEQPTKFELRINQKTAKALGLTIPPSVLGRADQVIE